MIARAAQDRSLGDDGRLFATVDAVPEAGRTRLASPAKRGRPARQATLAVRFSRVQIKRPQNGVDKDLPNSLSLHNFQAAKRGVDAMARECLV